MLKFFKKNKGFTLIELLVVIAIIAVLASIVLVSLNTARIKGRDARRIADIKSLQVALEMYYDGVGAGKYPTSLAALQTGGYIPAIPKDPKDNSTNYSYAYCPGTTNSAELQKMYHLGAKMEGITGTSGALGADVDISTIAAGNGCADAWTGGFDGDGASAATNACSTSAVTGDDNCYDIRN